MTRKAILFTYGVAIMSGLLMSCKKKEKKTPPEPEPSVTTEMASGLPSNINSINGYLYAGIKYNGSSSNYFVSSLYAAFSDPGRKLTTSYNHFLDNISNFGSNSNFGNIDVGSVTLNSSFFLSRSSFDPNVFYSSINNSGPFYNTAHWTSDGNMSFKPLDLDVPKGFPVLTYTLPFTSISRSTGFTLNMAQCGSNYDSITVSINDFSFPQGGIKKTVTPGVTSVTFSASDLSPISNSSGTLAVYAYNYSNQTINNKVYLFELSNKYSQYIYIDP